MDVAACVKPGGMVLMIEGEASVFQRNQIEMARMATDKNEEGSWLARYLYGWFSPSAVVLR